MKIHAAVPIIIGLALILSAPIVSKIAYAQARIEPSSNGVPIPNPMTPASGMVESGRNSAVQSVTGAISSLHGSSGVGAPLDIHSAATNGHVSTIISHVSTIAGIGFILASFFKFHQHKQNPQQITIIK